MGILFLGVEIWLTYVYIYTPNSDATEFSDLLNIREVKFNPQER